MVEVDANIQDPIAGRPNGKRAKFRHRFCGDRYTAFDLDRCFVGAADEMSTPQQKCIGWPEQKYIIDGGKKAPGPGVPFVRHQAWAGLSASVSELARRERCLL
jgi:hypothetical protein